MANIAALKKKKTRTESIALPFAVIENGSVEKTVVLDFKRDTTEDGRHIPASSSTYRNAFYYAMREIHGRQAIDLLNHEYPIKTIAPIFDSLDEHMKENGYDFEGELWFGVVHEYVNKFNAVSAERGASRLKKGTIEFDDIPYIFVKGVPVYAIIDGEPFGGILHSAIRRRNWLGTWYYHFSIDVLHYGTGVPQSSCVSIYAGQWDGMRPLDTLDIHRMSDEMMERLQRRGATFMKYVTKDEKGRPKIAQYSGHLTRSRWWSSNEYRADGRVMIDVYTFMTIDKDQYSSEMRNLGLENERNTDSSKSIEIGPKDYWRLIPYVYGFSLRAKQWGRLRVDGLSDVNWRDESFDKLVLSDEHKNLVRALVEHSGESFEDMIEGKGGGCIFLLHGPPGQGKTLTAETIAELLHRPLYSISVGELGVTPVELEERLRMILDVATVWNAVILLDEVDIYLEERDEHDIIRNAMVGVFLRLLEYHQGVLFLTSNRVRHIDRAFYSRISISIHFADGGPEKRRKIWRNLLEVARIDNINVDRLIDVDLNGRQIKTAIRLAQTLARAENKPVTTKLVRRVAEFSIKFEQEEFKKEQ